MNNEKLRKTTENLYLRGIQEVIKSIAHLLGVPVDDVVKKDIHRKTYPIVNRVRNLVSNIAYRDYSALVDDPVPQVALHRFTPELWTNSVDKATKDVSHVTVSVTEDIGMSGDYWARDAEWGQKVQLAHNDERIGRIARVDFEPPTCPLCTLMNSRGPVYLSQDSVARTLHVGDTCTGIFVPVGDTDYPGIEHTSEALRRYKQAVEAVGPHQGANAILKALKEQHPYEGPGKVRTAAQDASQGARDQQLTNIKSATARLERLQLKNYSAIRDELVSRNKEIINVLETQ